MNSDKSTIDITGKKITDIFSGDKTYKVPIFQREYVWKEQQWDDFWEDVIAEKEHYIGALVLQQKVNRESIEEFEIIDGQQRLVTIGLIAVAAINVLYSTKGDEAKGYAEAIRSMFIVNRNGKGKLILWGENRSFWNSTVVKKSLAKRKESASQKQMTKALEFFTHRFKKTEFDTPEKIHRLLTHAVGNCMICSRVVTAHQSDAHAVFATLNGKGRALSPTELIINYFLSTADDKKEAKQIRRQWDSISNIINSTKGKNDEMINFVRDFYNYRYGFSSRSQLYRTIVGCISNDGEKMRHFIDGMRDQCRFYNQLRFPDPTYWDNDNFEKADVLRRLRAQRYSLLMSIQESLPDSLPDALHICVAIGIRHEICGPDTRIIEKIYHRAARNIHKGGIESAQRMFDVLKENGAYPLDQQFQERFALYTANLDWSRAEAPMLQYLLGTIEEHLGNEDVDLNHLSRFDDWGGDTADSHRLGNHVFWEFDARPSEKTLANSGYRTTKMLADTIQREGKTPQAIVAHQKQLADIAAFEVANWRFDLSQDQSDEEE